MMRPVNAVQVVALVLGWVGLAIVVATLALVWTGLQNLMILLAIGLVTIMFGLLLWFTGWNIDRLNRALRGTPPKDGHQQ